MEKQCSVIFIYYLGKVSNYMDKLGIKLTFLIPKDQI